MVQNSDSPTIHASTVMSAPPTAKARLQTKIKKGVDKRASQVTGKVLRYTVGAGKKYNSVPQTEPDFDTPPRAIEIGWHPLGGFAGKWIAERTKLGEMIKAKINELPDPSQHWAVIVGDYAHQLWIDEKFHVMYTNERIKRSEWHTFYVGDTTFNDEAIRQAGELAIDNMRDKRPVYNLITNNCQTFALQLVDLIQAEEKMELATTLALFKKLRSLGKVFVADLFSDFDQEGKRREKLQQAPITVEIRDDHVTPLDDDGKSNTERGQDIVLNVQPSNDLR
ncbi:hypothetical protein HIM_09376 [Hirsutella minnesotensis 3608]|uniref:PPPDE domain-containing protein n=1 Tax=Hirsutella minnesotensis 3608 TaxID=1043627 RepID=A0A0F7ZSE7_9HYPO|nr:hypothetical protein HIM_09376 [Hirsutella minnesotensis 3608]